MKMYWYVMVMQLDDQITGMNNNNIIYGWIGNDYLRGMAGEDVILGGEGADTIIGDISNDVLNETAHGKDVFDRWNQEMIY